MERIKLPKKVLSMLQGHGIEPEHILKISATDMTTECEYADGFVILTASKLVILLSAPELNVVRHFKGCSFKDELEMEKDKDWAIKVYELSSIQKIEVERQVACGILVAQIQEQTFRLTAFSNLYKKKMHELVRTFEHLSEPKPDFMKEEKEEKEEYCPNCGRMYPNPDRKICPKCMDRGSIFLRIMKYFRPYTGKMIVMLLCYIATAALNLVWPYLSGTILYDRVLAKNEKFLSKLGLGGGKFITALVLVIGMMLLAKLTIVAFSILQGVFTAKIVAQVVCDMKKDIFKAMGQLSISFFKSRQTGNLMTRVLSDADRITGFFIDGAPSLLISAFTMFSTVVVMFTIRWQMALVACLLLPISLAISFYLRPRLFSLFGRRHRAERSVNSQVNDNLTGARVVKAFGQERREITRFSRNNSKLKNAELSIVKFNNYFAALYTTTQELTNIIIWIIGVTFLMKDGSMPVGLLITFVGYVGQLAGPMNFLARVFHWWSNSMNSAQRMFEILDAVPEVVEAESPLPLKEPHGEIELKNITFGYEANKPILKDISVHIPEGSMLGIVGRSGAGKTTLVNLISRMYDPQEGAIFLDGKNIKELSFHDLRRNVAMVSQETYIFMGTVEENIKYARPSATKAEVIRAAVLASAHEFILRMPDGYDTKIGSSGRELSGGERQRISIARAILANPKILILDEATASVDTETERAIQTSLNYLVRGRTTISIAHRLSTLKDADFLIVIDNGEITERGTHKQLEEQRGTYYKLMELQKKALAMKGLE